MNATPATTKLPAIAQPGRGAPTTAATGADGVAAATMTGAATVTGGRATGGALRGTIVIGGRTHIHDVTLGALGTAGNAGAHTHGD